MFFAGALITILLFTLFRGGIVRVIAPATSPIIQVSTWVSNKVFWSRSSRMIDPQTLQELFERQESLAIDKVRFEQLEEENILLRKELDFIERTNVQYVPAQILSKSISNAVSRIVIDIGSDQGVSIGSAVVVGEGIYVGKVTEVSRQHATVTSSTDPSLSVAVSLLNESRTIGLARGSIGDLLKIEFIPVDETVQKNDLVITSGLDYPTPSGLLIGVINAVTKEPESPFQEAIVEPLADVRKITSVLVATSNNEL